LFLLFLDTSSLRDLAGARSTPSDDRARPTTQRRGETAVQLPNVGEVTADRHVETSRNLPPETMRSY
nr:hypothetical protein [Micromonospora sp. DSM 115978]